MIELLNDEEKRTRLGKALHARVHSYFDKERGLNEWNDVFAGLLE